MSENDQPYSAGLSPVWIEADTEVRRIRMEVMRALAEARRKAADPSLREEAEAELKSTLKALDTPINEARRGYEAARQEHFKRSMEDKQYQNRNLNGQEVPEAIRQERTRVELAAARAASLKAFSAVVQAASRPETPFATAVSRSLHERLPEQAEEIINTQPGQLTWDGSVERALVLAPGEPEAWNPVAANDMAHAKQYLEARLELTDLDRVAAQSQRSTAGPRGASLAVESYAAMTTEQRGIAQAWANTSRSRRASVDSPQGRNSVEAETYAAKNGLPSLPAVDPTETNAGQAQKTMLKEAHGRKTGAVPIYEAPTVDHGASVAGMER